MSEEKRKRERPKRERKGKEKEKTGIRIKLADKVDVEITMSALWDAIERFSRWLNKK